MIKRILALILVLSGAVWAQSTPLPTMYGTQIGIFIPTGKFYVGIAGTKCLQILNANPPFTWTLVSGGVTQSGVSFSTSTGCFSGTPTGAGPLSWVVNGAGSSGPSTGNVTVTISPLTLSSILIGPANVSIQTSGTLQLTAQATWSDSSNTSLLGLATWSCSGTGYSSISSGGLFTASGSAGAPTCTASFDSITSNVLTITVSSSNPLITTPTTLPTPCDINFACQPVQFTASGGTPPYTWSITSGAPTGCSTSLSTSGLYTCTPTASGTFASFIIKVTDSLSATNSNTFTQAVGSISSRVAACSPTTITLNASTTCTATINFSDGGKQNVTNGSGGISTPTFWSQDNGVVGTTVTVTVAPTAGQTMHACASYEGDNTHLVSFSDSGSQSWTRDSTNTSYSTGRNSACGHFANTAAITSVTATAASGAATGEMVIVAWATGGEGSLDSGTIEVTGSTANTTSLMSSAYTSTSSPAIVYDYIDICCNQSSVTAPTGFTTPSAAFNTRDAVAYQAVSSVQTGITPIWSWAVPTFSSMGEGSIVFAFDAAAGTGAQWAVTGGTITSSGVATGTQVGTMNVSFTYGGGSSNTVGVTVNASQSDTSLIIAPSAGSGTVGSTVSYTATGNVTGASYTSTATWASSNTAIATSAGSGVFNCVAAGTSSNGVTASFAGLTSGTAGITCSNAVTGSSLLQGCVVTGTNPTSTSSVTGCAGTWPPAGWTLLTADGAENGVPPNEQITASPPNAIVTNISHTGGHSYGGQFTGDGSEISVGYYTLPSFHSMYISYWDYVDPNAMYANSDYNYFYWNSGVISGGGCGPAATVGIDGQWFNAVSSELTETFFPTGEQLLNNACDPSGFIGYNTSKNLTINAGTWIQVEALFTPNTTAAATQNPPPASCTSSTQTGCGNGTLEVWINGQVIFNLPNYNLNGTTSMSGAGSYVRVGGYITSFDPTYTFKCTTFSATGGGTCPGTQPGTGAPQPFHRYLDDIIMLYQ